MRNLTTSLPWHLPPLLLTHTAPTQSPFSPNTLLYRSTRRNPDPNLHPSTLGSHELAPTKKLDVQVFDRRHALSLLLLTSTISSQSLVAPEQAFAEVCVDARSNKGVVRILECKNCKRFVQADRHELTSLFTLEPYIDQTQGFTVMKPTTWIKIDKAGATVLFEDPESRGNNIGVVVNPVRISSLTEFGSIDVVAEKLLQAEKKKPSTNDAQLLRVVEKKASGGVPLYQVEYKLDSSRGVKRIFSAVTVAKKKLYILNVAFKDNADMPLPVEIESLLNQIVNSFDLLK